MPLKLNVGVSKKIGQPDYGSLGATCHVEVELDAALLQHDLDGFHQQVRNAFTACRQAVDDELSRQRQPESHTAANGSGRQTSGNGNGGSRSGGRRATASQIRALHAIADRQRLDLTAELRSRFGVTQPEDLSITEASQLIDAIKPQPGDGRSGTDRPHPAADPPGVAGDRRRALLPGPVRDAVPRLSVSEPLSGVAGPIKKNLPGAVVVVGRPPLRFCLAISRPTIIGG